MSRGRLSQSAGLLILVLLTSTGSGHAQLVDCPAILGETGHKVLLDDVRDDGTAAQSPAQVERFRDKLYFQLSANLEQLEVDFSDLAPRGFRCKGRWPSDGDLTADVTKVLNGRDVIVEVWGSAGIETGSDGKLYPTALLNYALIPARLYQDELNKLKTTYQAPVPESPGVAPGLSDLSETARRLQIYFTLSAGVKTLKNHDYNQALKLLCRSEALIVFQAAPAQGSVDARLLDRVRGLARETVAQALNDPDYLKAKERSIQLLSEKQRIAPCGGSKQ